MNMLFWIAALATGLLMPAARAKADYEVMTRNDIFCERLSRTYLKIADCCRSDINDE